MPNNTVCWIPKDGNASDVLLNASLNIEQLINKANTSTYKHEPFWKFGHLVPRTHWKARDLDKKNGNTFWQEAEATEMVQLSEYNTFIDKETNGTPTSNYKENLLSFGL